MPPTNHASEVGPVPFWLPAVGREHSGSPVAVSHERLVRFAAATNERDAVTLEGHVGAPVFAIVPIWTALKAASASVVPAHVRSRVVLGEHDIAIHDPIRPGTRVSVTAAVIGVHPKRSGTAVVLRARTYEDARLVNEQHVTEFYRGAIAADGAGEGAPARPVLDDTAPAAEVRERVDLDQAVRYAQASGDDLPIHLDDAAARAAGLPRAVLHGLCTLAFAARAVLETAGVAPERMTRLSVRFSGLVFPGDAIVTRVRRDGERAVFETVNEHGTVVLRDGWAEWHR
jgi:acyl dehydratase